MMALFSILIGGAGAALIVSGDGSFGGRLRSLFGMMILGIALFYLLVAGLKP